MGQVDPEPTWDLKLFCCWLSRRQFLEATGMAGGKGG